MIFRRQSRVKTDSQNFDTSIEGNKYEEVDDNCDEDVGDDDEDNGNGYDDDDGNDDGNGNGNEEEVKNGIL